MNKPGSTATDATRVALTRKDKVGTRLVRLRIDMHAGIGTQPQANHPARPQARAVKRAREAVCDRRFCPKKTRTVSKSRQLPDLTPGTAPAPPRARSARRAPPAPASPGR